jgi:hypothetical protein
MSSEIANLEELKVLTPEQKLHFFELLAHDLTVTIRSAWSEPTLGAEEKVEAMKLINECLHRVTARIWVERLKTHEWTDEDLVGLVIQTDAALHPKLRGGIAWAFRRAISHVQSNNALQSDAPKARA